MNILITGRPGCGKTTFIKELSERLQAKIGGFYTSEIRQGGVRTGFNIYTFDGKTGVLASIDTKSPHRVGKYKVDLKDFEETALPAIEKALSEPGIVIIDEIGPMELYSGRFKEIVIKALDSPNTVIATIKLKGSSFINAVKSRPDIVLYDLDRNGRETILQKILVSEKQQ